MRLAINGDDDRLRGAFTRNTGPRLCRGIVATAAVLGLSAAGQVATAPSAEASPPAPACVFEVDRYVLTTGTRSVQYAAVFITVRNACQTVQVVRIDVELQPDSLCEVIPPGQDRELVYNKSAQLPGGNPRGIVTCP